MKERFETFTVLIAGINRAIRRIKTEEMAELGLKSPHVSCLYYLYKADSLTATELCEICEEDKANISRSIRYLEENGYIVCKSKNTRRYQSPLELTEKGRAIGAAVAEKIDRILDLAGEGLSENDRTVLYAGLTLIYNNLHKICENYDQ